MPIGEEAVVADAMKAVGQDVQEEAVDERVGVEPHNLAPPFAAIILVGE